MDGLGHEDLLAVAGGKGVDLAAVGAVGKEGAGLHVVLQLRVEDPEELPFDLLVIDGAGDLHPAVQVAGHEVRGGDKELRVRPAAKAVDPPVLQIPAHDAGDMDVLRLPGDAGTETADAPQNQLYLDPRPGGAG